MKNIAVFALGLVLSCFLMLGLQQPYFKWVDSGGLPALGNAIDRSIQSESFSTTRLRKTPSILNDRTPSGFAPDSAYPDQRLFDASKARQIKNSSATQEAARYAFYAGCLGAGMLLGMAILWITYLSVVVIIAVLIFHSFNFALLYVGLPLFLLVASYLVANHFTSGGLHGGILNYLRNTRESNRLSKNKTDEKLNRFFQPLNDLKDFIRST